MTNSIPSKWFTSCLVLALVTSLTIMAGCKNIVPRAQSPDTAMKFSGNLNETTYVGNLAAPWGLNFTQIEGIGLVNRLRGTGSNPRVNDAREHLVAEMKSHGVSEVDEYLASDNNALVHLKGFMPPAAQKGDRFDLLLIAAPKSDTTSLANGYLMNARMRPSAQLGGRLREGNTVAIGNGSVIVNEIFDPSTGDVGKLQGIIPGGGIVSEPRPVGLAIQRESHSIKNSVSIAMAINDRFTTLDSNARIGVANAKNDKLVEILVPGEYRLNVNRFFRVLASIAINETAADRLDRLQRCEREINEPGMAKISAFRLEGIGNDAIPSLKRSLRSDDPEVRFYAAQSLTYMGESDGIEELEMAARNEPAFRWHALTALASSDLQASEKALLRLIDAGSAETRYGAFRALHQRAPNDPAYKGDLIDDQYYQVAMPTRGEPMIHVAKRHRPEIVFFGLGQKAGPDFLYVESGLTVKAIGRERLQVTRYMPGRPELKFTCSTDLEDLLPKLAKTGCDYASIVNVLKEAQLSQSLKGQLVINSLPDKSRKYDRSRAAAGYNTEQSERYMADPVPDMFDTGEGALKPSNGSSRQYVSDVDKTADRDSSGLPSERKPWSIVPNIFR